MTTPAVDVEHAVVEYDGRRVLDGIDLTIWPGEFVALLGANGAGKTTLLRATLGLIPLARGRVLLAGQPLAHFHDWSSVALVPQRLPTSGAVPVSVEEVVAAGLVGPRPKVLSRSSDKTAIARALDQVGLLGERRTRLDQLSGGQQRRVLIARALATGAGTFFLDEPTAGVDAESQQRLAEVLGQMSEEGATVILVTHELGPLAPLVTRTVILADGRILYDGQTPPQDFLHDHVHHHSHDDPQPPSALMDR